jgi:hypothetical protein
VSFQAWFDVEIHSMVLDLDHGQLKTARVLFKKQTTTASGGGF